MPATTCVVSLTALQLSKVFPCCSSTAKINRIVRFLVARKRISRRAYLVSRSEESRDLPPLEHVLRHNHHTKVCQSCFKVANLWARQVSGGRREWERRKKRGERGKENEKGELVERTGEEKERAEERGGERREEGKGERRGVRRGERRRERRKEKGGRRKER